MPPARLKCPVAEATIQAGVRQGCRVRMISIRPFELDRARLDSAGLHGPPTLMARATDGSSRAAA